MARHVPQMGGIVICKTANSFLKTSLTKTLLSPCDDQCCDNFQGPDRLGNNLGSIHCQAIPGLRIDENWDDGEPRYECLFSTPPGPSPTPTPTCLANAQFACGYECCMEGIICNTQISQLSFCGLRDSRLFCPCRLHVHPFSQPPGPPPLPFLLQADCLRQL